MPPLTRTVRLAALVALLLGAVALAQQPYETLDQTAITQFKRAFPSYEKARVAFNKQEYDKARKELDACLEKMPNLAEAHFLLAKVLYIERDHERALAHVLEAKKHFFQTASLFSRMQQERREADDAKRQQEYDRIMAAVSSLPSTPEGQQQREQLMLRAQKLAGERHRSGVDPLEVAPAIPAEYSFIHGNILLRMNRLEEAVAQYDAALRQQPDYAEAANNLASLYLAAKRPQLARTVIERVEAAGATVNPELKQAVLDATQPKNPG